MPDWFSGGFGFDHFLLSAKKKFFLVKFKRHVCDSRVRRASCQAVSRCDVSLPAVADTTQPVFASSPPTLDSTGCHRRRRHGYDATYVNDVRSWKKDSFREFRSKFARRVRQCRWIDRASNTEKPPSPERPRWWPTKVAEGEKCEAGAEFHVRESWVPWRANWDAAWLRWRTYCPCWDESRKAVRTGRWRSISPWPTSKIVLSWSQWNGGEIIKASTTKKRLKRLATECCGASNYWRNRNV